MQSKAKNVVILNNVKSDYIEQAIFILKHPRGSTQKPMGSIVSEAEKIVESYNKRLCGINEEEKPKKYFVPLIALFALSSAALFLFLKLFVM